MSIIRCVKRVPMGLFSVDEGTIWFVEGVKYNTDKAQSIVRIREKAEPNRKPIGWAEIPQSILAECFEIV